MRKLIGLSVDGVTAPRHQSNGTNRGSLETYIASEIDALSCGVWIEQGSRNERTTLTREGVVPCRPASHAGRERVLGSCGEREHKLGSRWVDQPSQEVGPFLSIRIHHNCAHPQVATNAGAGGELH